MRAKGEGWRVRDGTLSWGVACARRHALLGGVRDGTLSWGGACARRHALLGGGVCETARSPGGGRVRDEDPCLLPWANLG